MFTVRDGYLFCEELRMKEIQERVDSSPFYLYSAGQLRNNYRIYKTALVGIPSEIAYAVKANGNLTILNALREMGSWVTLVSGNEIHLALSSGFEPGQMIFNGNGKTISEIQLAIDNGTFINIDSVFDLKHIYEVSQEKAKNGSVFLRINPNIEPQVHPYIATGQLLSKFGVPIETIPTILSLLRKMPSLSLEGIHCHLGSTIDDVNVFYQTMKIMANQFERIRDAGFPLRYLNIGGGLGIDYTHKNDTYPSPRDLVENIKALLPDDSILILEPGRSIIGNSGILVCKVIGVKTTGEKNFIVIDGSMTELIRPSLYRAYHKIEFIEPVIAVPKNYDIVGPVCESTDFLGQNRYLPTPEEGVGVAVFDTGAYGYVMSSNYNARNRPAEYMVDRSELYQIRKPETFEDQVKLLNKVKVENG
jgi:diaminopimelate decarboxylase